MEFRLQTAIGMIMLCMVVLLAGCGSETVEYQRGTETTGEAAGEVEAADGAAAAEDATVFVLTGENFKFVMGGADNPELRVKKGDVVTIEFRSTMGFHDWVVDELGAATKQVRPEDGMTKVTFTADKAGTFEYYCSVGSHRELGMKGMLVVEE